MTTLWTMTATDPKAKSDRLARLQKRLEALPKRPPPVVEPPVDEAAGLPTGTPQVLYVATAYRWGTYNEHHYLVAAGLDKEAVLAQAKGARDDRAGKYGVEVVAMPAAGTAADPAVQYGPIAYFPSMAGEDRAEEDQRREALVSFGHQVLEVVQSAKHWVADVELQEGVYSRKPVEVEVPAWVQELAEDCGLAQTCPPPSVAEGSGEETDG